MKKTEELIRTKAYWMTIIQNDLYAKVEQYMINKGINRTQLAAELGVTKGYISQVLNGDFNHSLGKLIELALSVGVVPQINFKSIEAYDKEINGKFKKQKPMNSNFIYVNEQEVIYQTKAKSKASKKSIKK
ncbi:MAG TPA: helix-turn-helix transcriptional regulator [Bacteroidia bacterium]